MDRLQRQLGVAAVTTLVIGEVIAIGIFLTPATMARSLGSPLSGIINDISKIRAFTGLCVKMMCAFQ